MGFFFYFIQIRENVLKGEVFEEIIIVLVFFFFFL